MYKHQNTIAELSRMISEKAWADETMKDQFVIAALADGIHSAAEALDELFLYLKEEKSDEDGTPD
ncbi:hypothetical protein [Methylomicrobium sp. Wu6]|uniref:hypothetical protein n=1 Tax=Methylomicrobium sp. Wu6 TaxID=3107928 RepID=UPI002DD6936A|nr:hypothetical protein [Methylomicrobium sp. Wu6]MEC4746939.1 hypothetical protein [Methylomicrobium sp. Wu6]